MVSDRLFDRACNDLQAQTRKVLELEQMNSALLARVARLEEVLKDAERVLEWAEPQPRPVLIRVRRALEEK